MSTHITARCDTCDQPIATTNIDTTTKQAEHNLWRHPTPEQRADALETLLTHAQDLGRAWLRGDWLGAHLTAGDLSTAALLVKAQTEELV